MVSTTPYWVVVQNTGVEEDDTQTELGRARMHTYDEVHAALAPGGM